MRWKKPKWVSKVQKGAQNVAKAVVPTSKPPILQQIQNVAQKAADTVGHAAKKAGDAVGDAVRPAAQTVAKEVGHVVNPIAGEIALRGKQLAENPTLNKIGDAIAGEAATWTNVYKDRQPKNKMDTQYKTGLEDDGSTAATDRFRAERKLEAELSRGRLSKTAEAAQAGQANSRIDKKFEQDIQQGKVQPITRFPWESGGEQSPEGLPQDGVKVANANQSPVLPLKPPKKEPTALDRIIQAASKPIEDAIDTTTKAAKKTAETVQDWVIEGTDNFVVKGFASQFRDVMDKKTLEKFREAQKDGDIKTMDAIRDVMRQKLAQSKVGTK
jgi:hypothetical protein